MQLPNPDPASFILDKKYKQLVVTMEENQYFQAVREGINALDINQKMFKSIQGLISFFKFPILIHLKTPIMKLLSSPGLLDQYKKDLKKIAKMAQDIIGQGGRIYQLDFLFQKGIDQTFYKKIQIKQEKRKFINYIKKLSQQKRLLQKKLKDKTLTEKDILDFESLQYDTQLKFLQGYFENFIKTGVKEIEEKFNKMKKQFKKSSMIKSQSQSSDDDSYQQQQKAPISKITRKQNPHQHKQQQIMLCCRRSFYHKQLIEQPQSINFVYKYWRDIFDQANNYELLKNICGLLNSQGGYLFIGIKEDKNTYKKQVEGYTIIEKEKQQFRRDIDQLVHKCILPTISHDMLKILFVPIKNQQTGQFISGRFLIKISVRFGQRKQFYSFKQNSEMKKQYFAIRTDNDTKMITNGQEILNIYKNRLLQTPPQPKPIHKDQCPKPQTGKLLYEAENYSR